MHHRVSTSGWIWLLALIGWVGMPTHSVQGDDRAPSRRATQQQGAGLTSPLDWDAEVIMKPIVTHIARNYNLNERQERYTRLLMTRRVKNFLEEYEREVRSLLTEYWNYQFNGQLPPASALEEFARRARPLLAAIHKEIVDGNMQWREILNEKQKKLHDRDLRAIDQNFKRFDQRFARWEKGDVRPSDFSGRIGQKPQRIMRAEDAWEYYVRTFIQNYRLDAGQRQAARSVLREMREQAAAYRRAHRAQFDALEAEYAKLQQAAPKKDPKRVAEARQHRKKLDARRRELETPITQKMFEKLKRRLRSIPRSDQRRDYEERQERLNRIAKKDRAELEERLAGASQPASKPQSAPASKPQPASGP